MLSIMAQVRSALKNSAKWHLTYSFLKFEFGLILRLTLARKIDQLEAKENARSEASRRKSKLEIFWREVPLRSFSFASLSHFCLNSNRLLIGKLQKISHAKNYSFFNKNRQSRSLLAIIFVLMSTILLIISSIFVIDKTSCINLNPASFQVIKVIINCSKTWERADNSITISMQQHKQECSTTSKIKYWRRKSIYFW